MVSKAKGVAVELRTDLFRQRSGMTGPEQFGNMAETLMDWKALALKSPEEKQAGEN